MKLSLTPSTREKISAAFVLALTLYGHYREHQRAEKARRPA